MYLKSIEVQGFKSFANKIKLEFHNGFTGIVGPNGSGKSNVADAVRWVLGEQRVKQLRGASMQDVIFAGTELRKPLSFAYVAITLDNKDHVLPVSYDEVTVARRLYRSGESEYLLNGAQVRLRDVQELFYDTGIGKEGYSIIGQGQIEKILSDKPEDRRELFDEAAGIVKFKHRKDTSLKKLESERANLVRINDILSELEKQVGPLEIQAKKARIYLDTREELKKLDVNVFLIENSRLQKSLEETTQTLENTRSGLAATESALENAKQEYESLRMQLEELEKGITGARDAIANAQIVRQKLEGDIKLYNEQIRSAKSNAEHFHNRETTVLGQIREREEEKQKVLDKKNGVDEQFRKLNDALEKARKEQQEAQEASLKIAAAIDEKRAGILELLNTRAEIKARQAALQEKREQYDIRRSELTGKLVRASSDEAEHDRQIERLNEIFRGICDEINDLNRQQEELEGQIAGKKTDLTNADEGLRNVQALYHRERSKLEALRNLTERYEGFGGSVKRVMEHKDTERGLIGVVADLIKTEPKYETAIEVALGGSIQNIVTTDEDTAKRMIAMLKREKAGRATFLPLSGIRETQPFNMAGALKEPGVIGLADTLVRVSPQYGDVAKSLLGRIVVADTFDHAAAVQRKYGHKLRMVTLEGELFVPGGAISGGAYKNSSNLLGRRREIADLEKNVRTLKKEMENTENSITSIKEERNLLRAKLETVKLRLQGKFLEQNTAKMNISAEEEKKEESVRGYDALREENASIKDMETELEAEEKAILKELEESDRFENRTTGEITLLQKDLTAARELEDEKAGLVGTGSIEVEKFRQSMQFGQQELDRVESELERLAGELEEIRTGISAGDQTIEEKQHYIEQTTATIEASKADEEKSRRLLSEGSSKREELTKRQSSCLSDRDRYSDEKAGLDKEVFRLEAQQQRIEESVESQAAYMWNEYEITLSQAAELRDESLDDLPGMKKEIAGLKSRIKSLGSVNVGAIEEYQEVKERYTFMKGQHDDLIEAEKSLEKIIDELDRNMRAQFKSQFARIQQEFDKVFKELFGGGTGRLELMEDEDILTAGVKVIAQPPGKKLQNMMQMSGGEKSLTAISLLFAIQNLKPSPFCLLDEIEAALDESNVGRFAAYIHKLTKHTQFIVITHRRGTMDRADRLYGITMQEKGVSTLVSVSLIDDKELTD